MRQHFADHAGGGQKNLLGLAADQLGSGGGAGFGGFHPSFAGEDVGVAGVDDNRAGLAASQRIAAPVNRGAGAFGGGEHAGDGGGGGQFHHHQVGAALVADAGGGGAEADAGQRRQHGQGDGER